MKGSGRLILKGILTAVGFAVASGQLVSDAVAQAQGPLFQVDPFWMQPLDYPQILGSVNGLSIDSSNNIFLLHGGQATLVQSTEGGAGLATPNSECCLAAPFVLQFDPQGNRVAGWGGPGQGYTWPTMPNGIAIDPHGSIWIGGNGSAPVAQGDTARIYDAQILKFSTDGRFMDQYGEPARSANPTSTSSFFTPVDFAFDAAANEAFVADAGNHRIAVLDISTGAVKRFWGAYGTDAPALTDSTSYNPSAPASRQFGVLSCVAMGRDGLLYVCDRTNNRIQIFRTDGTFVSEAVIAPQTLGRGSVWDIAFSPDPQQRFLYVADGHNMKVHILDRATLTPISSVGRGGRYPGHFYGVGSVVTDSEGSLYTGETYHGKRLQKFEFMGIGPVPAGGQGPAWPTE